jgi:NADPH2:quinone reductase
MKAVLCKAYGPPETLVFEEIEPPVPGPGEAVISVKAASVNFPDVLIIENKYQVKPPLPFSPGSELAGVVAAVGEGVTTVRAGDRVMAITGYGAFAEAVKTDARRLLPIPPGMDFPTAAAFGLTYATSEHALVDRGALKSGETLLVLGAAGGVGLAAIEIGKILGARVIACASTDDKLAVCREHGADETINYATDDLRERIKTLTTGAGADVVYDPVGGDAFDASLRCIAWEGRIIVIGFAGGRVPQIPANLVLVKNCDIIGFYWGSYRKRKPAVVRDSYRQLFGWWSEGKLKPHISDRFDLAEVATAMRVLRERRATGKVVLTTGRR